MGPSKQSYWHSVSNGPLHVAEIIEELLVDHPPAMVCSRWINTLGALLTLVLFAKDLLRFSKLARIPVKYDSKLTTALYRKIFVTQSATRHYTPPTPNLAVTKTSGHFANAVALHPICRSLETMTLTIREVFSAFKKKCYDELPDYDKGKLHGILAAHMAFVTVEIGLTAWQLFARYRW